ncbi:hypothetical protein HGB13_02895 [bacterium]|nr:hypothetical protein [bacterium]
MAKNIIKKTKKEILGLQVEIINTVKNLVVTSLGLVAALAWNEAIKKAFELFFPDKSNGLKAMFLYAILVTLVIVLVTYYVSRLADKFNNRLEELSGETKKSESGKKKKS